MKDKANKTTTNFLEVIQCKLEDDPELREGVERESFNLTVAKKIYDARSRAKLTQAQLAAKANTSQSIIARLEDADYDGHSLKMLRRIADALNCRLEVELCPIISPSAGENVSEPSPKT